MFAGINSRVIDLNYLIIIIPRSTALQCDAVKDALRRKNIRFAMTTESTLSAIS